MARYLAQDWSQLKEDVLAWWGLLDPECKFTIGQLSEFCKETWVAGGVVHHTGDQIF